MAHKLSQEMRISIRKKIIEKLNSGEAVKIRDDYTIEYVSLVGSTTFTLEQLQKSVDGYIEVYPDRLFDNSIVFVDEEGLLKKRIPNVLAKDIFGIDIVGDAFIVPNNLLHEEA